MPDEPPDKTCQYKYSTGELCGKLVNFPHDEDYCVFHAPSGRVACSNYGRKMGGWGLDMIRLSLLSWPAGLRIAFRDQLTMPPPR